MAFLVDPAIEQRVGALQIPFGKQGVDPYGVDRRELARFMSISAALYRRYFRVKCVGIEHVPLIIGTRRGLVSNGDAPDYLGGMYNNLERRSNIWGLSYDQRQKFVDSSALEIFDPAKHEAVSTVPAPSPELDGRVIGVVRPGYVMGEDVLRPAQVAVARN